MIILEDVSWINRAGILISELASEKLCQIEVIKEVIQDGLFGVLPIFLHLFSLPLYPWMPKQSCKSPPRADMPVQQTFKTVLACLAKSLHWCPVP